MRPLLILMLLTVPASAQDCAGSSQRELDACAAASLEAADAALNATYQEIVGRIADDANIRAKLVASERAWLAFRDAQCAFASSGVEGGSAAPMIVADCRASVTTRRQVELAAYLTCQEGDLSCPVPAK